jgi:amidase
LTDDLAEYLASRPQSPVKTLDEIIAFNERNADKELKHFDQDLFLRARELKGKNDEYRAKYDRNLSWAQSILHHGFSNADILIGSTFAPAWESNLETGDTNIDASWITMAPAIAGFPIGTLPMGLVNGLPVGIGIVARRGREDQLISAMALIERVLGLGVLRPSFIK